MRKAKDYGDLFLSPVYFKLYTLGEEPGLVLEWTPDLPNMILVNLKPSETAEAPLPSGSTTKPPQGSQLLL